MRTGGPYPYEECPPDDVCVCGKQLEADPAEGSLAWDGFCSVACRERHAREVEERNQYWERISGRAC